MKDDKSEWGDMAQCCLYRENKSGSCNDNGEVKT